MSASTIFTIAFVPFISIPIHAKSFLSSLILSTIFFVSILLFNFPIFSPFSSNVLNSSSLFILEFPLISIFHTKFDNNIIATIKNKRKIINIFLFLYLLKTNGKPFFSFILTLHFVFLATLLIFLKSLIPILLYTKVDFVLFIFHNSIFFEMHKFINFSTKYPSISIFK